MVLPLSATALAWGRLLRLSLFATAAADPLVGAFLAHPGTPPARAFLAPLASLAVYHGAMGLNDLMDRELDAERGRRRPLVEGSVTPTAAGVAVVLLLALGLALAWVAGGTAGLAWLGAAALTAVVYDTVGRGPLLGPLLLAIARGTNLLFGAACAGWVFRSEPSAPLVTALGYGAYVLVVGRLGRMEDGDEGQDLGDRPRHLLGLLAVLLVLAPVLTGILAWVAVPVTTTAHLVSAIAGAFVGLRLLASAVAPLRAARRPGPWSPSQVEAVMGIALSRLLPLTVACLLLASPTLAGLLAAAVLVLLGRLGRRLMAVFPPS